MKNFQKNFNRYLKDTEITPHQVKHFNRNMDYDLANLLNCHTNRIDVNIFSFFLQSTNVPFTLFL